jgi:hypothetical protein
MPAIIDGLAIEGILAFKKRFRSPQSPPFRWMVQRDDSARGFSELRRASRYSS